jgi:hypothetical protein
VKSQPKGRQNGKQAEAYHIFGMTAQVPIHHMIGGVEASPQQKASQKHRRSVDGSKANKAVTPIPIWKAPTSCTRCSLEGGNKINATHDRGQNSAQIPNVKATAPQSDHEIHKSLSLVPARF